MKKSPELVCQLGHLEEAVKKNWPYAESRAEAQQDGQGVKTQTASNWLDKLVKTVNVSKRHDLAVTESTSTTELKVDQLNSVETATHIKSEQVVLEVFDS